MPYSLTSITLSDKVKTGFAIVNSNLNKQIVSGRTSGSSIQFVSKDGTIESVNLSGLTSFIKTGSTLPYVALTGDTMTGPLNVNDDNNRVQTRISGNCITFYDDSINSNINLRGSHADGGDYNIYLTETNGNIVIVPDPASFSNQIVKANSSGGGFDYLNIIGSGTTSVSYSGNTLVINSTGVSGGSVNGVTGQTAIGGGIQVISSITNNSIIHKTLSAGTNITISDSNGLITINSTASGSTGGSGVTGGTSNGGGIAVYSSATSTDLNFRSISGSNGFEAALSGDLVVIRPLNRTINRVYVTDASVNQINSASLQVDNTNGTLGIGQAALTTARLSFPAASASIAQMLFTKGATTVTSPSDGMLWYLTAGDTLKFRKNTVTTDFIFADNNIRLTGSTNNRVVQADASGTISALSTIVNFGIFNQITSTTINTSTSELSLISTGLTSLIGTTTLNASTHASQPQLLTGKKFRFNAKGQITTKNSGAGTLNIKIYLGSTVIAQTSAITLTNNVNLPNVFDIECTFTIRSQGASGTVIGSGIVNCSTAFHTGGFTTYGIFNQGVLTIDTTSDQIFNATAQWSVSDATNNLEINEATLEYLN
jgi:hypothetical protein